jgi:hypothetical protein
MIISLQHTANSLQALVELTVSCQACSDSRQMARMHDDKQLSLAEAVAELCYQRSKIGREASRRCTSVCTGHVVTCEDASPTVAIKPT